MFKKISESIVNSASDKKIIKNDDRDEMIYGLNTFLTVIVNILSSLFIGFLFHMVAEVILFILVYKSLRKYVGGSHASTAWRCYISSCVTYVIVLICIMYYPLTNIVTTVAVFISAIVLWILAPVEAPKKPLDEVEQKVFKQRSRISIIVCVFVFLIIHYIPNQYTYYYSNVVAISIYTVALFAIIGKLQLIHLRKYPVCR